MAKGKQLEAKRQTLRTLRNQAEKAIASSNFEYAQTLFDKMILSGANPELVGISRSEVYEKQGRTRLAYLSLKQAIGEERTNMSTASTDAWLLVKVGEWERHFGNTSASEEYYRRAIKAHNHDLKDGGRPIETNKLSSADIRAIAISLAALEQCERSQGIDAVRYMKTAAQVAPKLAIVQFALGLCMMDTGGGLPNPTIGREAQNHMLTGYELASTYERSWMAPYLKIHGVGLPN